MIRRAHWGCFSLLLAPAGAWALGLGDIELRSALNQPLDADIALVSPTPEELSDLRVALAAPETFERYGLDRPGFLSLLSFNVVRDDAGRDVIRVTSLEPIVEPFVTVLVEATWNRGRLLREYTVFLDPPVMLPAEAVIEPIEPAVARAPAPAEPAAVIERPAAVTPEPAPEPMPAPAPEPVPVSPPAATAAEPEPAPEPMPAPMPEPESSVAPAPVRVADSPDAPGAYGPVQRGQTLWGIAAQYRPAGITMNQMMIAMYEANPAAFMGNMNLLREGATLVIPDSGALASVSAAEATQEAIRQTAEWREPEAQQARLRLVAPEVETTPAAGVQDTATMTDTDPVQDVEDSAGADQPATPTAGLEEPERILSIEDQSLADLQQQLGAGQAVEVTDTARDAAATGGEAALVEPGVDLESEQIFVDDSQPATDQAEGAADLAGPDEATANVEEPAAEEPADSAVVAPPPRTVSTPTVITGAPEPSLVSRVIGWLTTPLVWMIAGLLALIGAGVVYLRTRHVVAEEELTGRWEALDEDTEEDLETREATERLRSQVRVDDETIVVEEQHTQELPQREQVADELFDIGEADEDPATLPDLEPEPEVAAVPEPEVAEAPEPEITASPEPEVAAAPESPAATGRFAVPEETMSSQTVINLDQADPIAEADFHMAYGLYDQAADLVTKALESDPENRNLRLKLLEVYFVWGNRESFLDTARVLHAEIGATGNSDWDKVVIMGKQICPDEEMFADATAMADSVDLDLAAGDAPALDLAFEDEEPAAVDLDLGGGEADVTLELASSAESADATADIDIGEQTAAGLEAAFLPPSEEADESAKTSPNIDLDDDNTQETPTLEAAALESALDSPTVELGSPETSDMDTLASEAPTMESPALDIDTEASAELPALAESDLSGADGDAGERTAEIDLDDLGLNVDDLPDLADATVEQEASLEVAAPSEDVDDDVLSATGVTQVLSAADAQDGDDPDYARTEVLEASSDEDTDATANFPGMVPEAAEQQGSGLDLDLDELSAALDGGDTVEQPSVSAIAGGSAGVDLDIGVDIAGSDDPTATEQLATAEPQTMTEVGTKLDLARAYIDMGDPEGARSILEEVLDEGDSGQQQEAKGLIDAL